MNSKPFGRLTSKQQTFVQHFIANGGNAYLAVKKAFPSATAISLRSMGHQLRYNPKVAAALEFWLGRTERETFCELLETQLREAVPGSAAAAEFAATLARVKFGVNGGDEVS